MKLETGIDPDISHPLSSVYGMYVIEIDGEARFCTANVQFLFEQIERIAEKDCHKARIVLLSTEEFAKDDITAFVWEAMAEDYAGMPIHLIQSVEEWDDVVAKDVAFIKFGLDEFYPEVEREKRRADRANVTRRAEAISASVRSVPSPYAVAAE